MERSQKTISAIATPPGAGGIAVVRISGPKAIEVADRVFSSSVTDIPTHTVRYGKIHHNGEILDEVLLVVMHGPRTFTGLDVVEIQCHGGSLIAKNILEAVLDAGAEMAGPGEFTYQAFMSGKIDLTRAEAIQSMIGAKNELSLKAATSQLTGRLAKKVETFQSELLDAAATLEASVDFPEEGLEFTVLEQLLTSLRQTRTKMEHLKATFEEGKKLSEGINLCLIGSPNAGKSSLMNTLLGQDRAIVTPLAGTTRDLLEAPLSLGGLHFQLTDTAGIRETDELIEQEGIRRSRQAMEEADLVFLLVDLSSNDQTLLATAPKEKTLLIWNKVDLPHTTSQVEWPNQVAISAKTGEGIDLLKAKLEAMIWREGPPSKDEVVLTQARHKESLASAILHLDQVIQGCMNKVSPEFISVDMRSCLQSLSSILGIDISEEILGQIFSKFCVGK